MGVIKTKIDKVGTHVKRFSSGASGCRIKRSGDVGCIDVPRTIAKELNHVTAPRMGESYNLSTSTATPPVPMAVALEDTSPTVTPTNAQPPAGIATLQQIAGVTKNDQATIDGAVASTIATVLKNGLDVESRAKLDGTMA